MTSSGLASLTERVHDDAPSLHEPRRRPGPVRDAYINEDISGEKMYHSWAHLFSKLKLLPQLPANLAMHAACLGTPTSLFYDGEEGFTARSESRGRPTKSSQTTSRQAQAVCSGSLSASGERTPPCPVQSECLVYALSNNVDHGVWGGTSAKQRRQLRRVMGVPASVPSAGD